MINGTWRAWARQQRACLAVIVSDSMSAGGAASSSEFRRSAAKASTSMQCSQVAYTTTDSDVDDGGVAVGDYNRHRNHQRWVYRQYSHILVVAGDVCGRVRAVKVAGDSGAANAARTVRRSSRQTDRRTDGRLTYSAGPTAYTTLSSVNTARNFMFRVLFRVCIGCCQFYFVILLFNNFSMPAHFVTKYSPGRSSFVSNFTQNSLGADFRERRIYFLTPRRHTHQWPSRSVLW